MRDFHQSQKDARRAPEAGENCVILFFLVCFVDEFSLLKSVFLYPRSEEKSPQWLKELKSKKRQSHYENQV